MQEAPSFLLSPDRECVSCLHPQTFDAVYALDIRPLQHAAPGRCTLAIHVWRRKRSWGYCADMVKVVLCAAKFTQARLYEQVGWEHPNWRVLYSVCPDKKFGTVVVERVT